MKDVRSNDGDFTTATDTVSRLSPRPTVVHCLDGCGRSGTLVLIEAMLMQLLRGTSSSEYPVLTTAVFVRLQRHHAIANYMQYVYVYRVLLHFIHPYVESTWHRYSLGLLFPDSGFIGKFDELALNWAQKSLL
uniref:TYR_PHOSPHATASE_2 domain-containing protein n=1 Tax=Panagrellus redivivus TaxID=6233 RepID=A0A7E4VEY0_PANRE